MDHQITAESSRPRTLTQPAEAPMPIAEEVCVQALLALGLLFVAARRGARFRR
jgi:hypothetical protein